MSYMEIKSERWWPSWDEPHPLGPQRFESSTSPEAKRAKERDDANKLKKLMRLQASTDIRIAKQRTARDLDPTPRKNVEYIELLNKRIELTEDINRLFQEQS